MMGKIVAILNYEEGYRKSPYIDTEGYPTVAGGIKIGPKGAPLSNYIFTVPRLVGDAWQTTIAAQKLAQMKTVPAIAAALSVCNDARTDILLSMAYQIGVGNPKLGTGLAGFTGTLGFIAKGDFAAAAAEMINSKWAQQTPNRARRHAQVISDGSYNTYAGLL